MIDDLLAARLQMAVSLGFHILFAVAGMAMPLLMVLAEWRFYKTSDTVYRELAHRWAKGTAILFAVGAVSGTVLSFELGLLWPAFMEQAGPIIGMPFSLEGLAFFLEAIALGVYLYGWDRVSPRVHLWSGVLVALSGAVSGVVVVAVNAFMNSPQGFELGPSGELVSVDLWRAFFTPAFPTQALHMLVASYSSVGFAVLGIHAWSLRRQRSNVRFHAAALNLVFPLLLVVTPLQALTGDFAAKHIAKHQPSKLAAAESLWETQRGAPLLVGGLPLDGGRRIVGGVHIPKLLSFLATASFDGEVIGLADIPENERPPVLVPHIAFQIMVGCGSLMLALVGFGALLKLKKRALDKHPLFLRLAMLSGPLGLLAVEAGWTVTEVGRQPWIIRGVMLVSEAVTPMPGLVISLMASIAVYLFLGAVVALLLFRHVVSVPLGEAPLSSGPELAQGAAAE